MANAVEIIVDLGLNAKVLNMFNVTQDDLAAMGELPKTWVELAVLQIAGDHDLLRRYLPDALDSHRLVSGQSSAHLNLVADNTYRTPWLAAKLLSKEAGVPQDAAAALLKHLGTTRRANRTKFENHLVDSPELMRGLKDFQSAEPPVLLWHGHCAYAYLFKFLAPRFLLNPDHVLDAERVHARWQWCCDQQRGMKMRFLNGSLRIMHVLEHNQGFPSHDELLPHLHAERVKHRLALEALHA